MYKLVREDAGFLSVGILVSDALWRGTGHGVSYVELFFGLFGTEKKAEGGSNYVKLLECLFQAVSTLCNGFDLRRAAWWPCTGILRKDSNLQGNWYLETMWLGGEIVEI